MSPYIQVYREQMEKLAQEKYRDLRKMEMGRHLKNFNSTHNNIDYRISHIKKNLIQFRGHECSLVSKYLKSGLDLKRQDCIDLLEAYSN